MHPTVGNDVKHTLKMLLERACGLQQCVPLATVPLLAELCCMAHSIATKAADLHEGGQALIELVLQVLQLSMDLALSDDQA